MSGSKIKIPSKGEKISYKNGKLSVPENPIIPFIEGDGIGVDITPVMIDVVDAAIASAYGGKRKISWMEVYCGEKSVNVYGADEWLPEETLQACRDYVVSIKGPLTTPVGGGIRSLNVALRQVLDLYVCLRPVKYFDGTPSPVKRPDLVDMVIFRENSEDIYAGVEFESGSDESNKIIDILQSQFNVEKIRFTENCGIGIKPVSEEGSKRLIRKSFEYAIQNNRDSVTLIHKGNIQKFTEGAFRDWGYELAKEEFGGEPFDGGPWHTFLNPNNNKPIIDIENNIIPNIYFNIIKLSKGEEFAICLKGYEICIVPATGSIDVEISNKTFKNIGNRKTDVWDGEPECIYIPCNQEAKIKCVSRNCELFIAGAKYDKILEPFVIRSNEIDLVQYGSDETKTHRKI